MHVAASRSCLADTGWVQLALPARNRNQLDTTRSVLGAAAFVSMNMGIGVANNAVIGLAQACQGQRIGGCAGHDQKDPAIGLEELLETRLSTRGPVVIAVGISVSLIGCLQGFQCLGT